MCGRFTLTIAERRMAAEILGVDPDSIPDYYRPRYNIAPTDEHLIVTMEYENRNAAAAKWGLINREEKDRGFAARRKEGVRYPARARSQSLITTAKLSLGPRAARPWLGGPPLFGVHAHSRWGSDGRLHQNIEPTG